jgi:flagellar protein FliO/FliZ
MEANSLGAVGGDVSLVRSILSLILVLGCMLAAYWWLRKKSGSYSCLKRRMRVIERLPIDARRSLMLVEVDGRELMLGVTNEQISTLKEISKEPDHA